MPKERDLIIPENRIRDFLEAAKKRFEAARSRVAYGSDESEHYIYTGATDDEVKNRQHVVVVLAVRRKNGRSRVLYRGVRQPDEHEWTELGAVPQTAWSDGLAARIDTLFAGELKSAIAGLAKETELVHRRFQVSYTTVAGIQGEYWHGPWRIGPQVDPAEGQGYGEKILLCDRLVPGTDPFAPMVERDRLAALLSVVWHHHFRAAENAEHVWVYNEFKPGEELMCRLSQRGYADRTHRAEMPKPGELSPAGRYRDVDRLDPHGSAQVAGEPLLPPSDSPAVFDRYHGADPDTAERFLAACKAYQTALALHASSPTGGMSYLVVAAEALIDKTVERCECCDQVKGVSRAVRHLFFEMLPCLEQQREDTERFLNRAYTVRSGHFHAGNFVAGELEPFYQSEYLLPARMAAWTTFRRLSALVNSLLIAWLFKRTGETWPRATQDPPAVREPKYFSVSAHLAPAPAAEATPDPAPADGPASE